MREKRTAQTSLFDPPAIDHPLADGLERASVWLDEHPELLDEIAADLGADTGAARGRHGLTCETILRCAVLKHLRQETCRGLEFALRDSRSAQRFARVDTARLPKKSALQAALGAVSATTWERINRHLLGVASAAGIETGNRLRIDSTVTHTHILEPADSRLLYDGIRVLSRLLGTAPTHAAFDGGYASRENLKQAKALGVTHAMFHKKRGMKETDMSPSPWVYRQLKRFRAGIEAGISYLKRCFGLGLCRWRGWPRFQAYVHSAVFAHQPDAPRATAPAAGLTPSASHRRVPVQRPASARARCLKIDALRGQTHGPGDARRARARGESAFLPTNRICDKAQGRFQLNPRFEPRRLRTRTT